MWQFWKSQSANLNDSKTQKKLILLTGSVGRIGRYLRKELEEDYQFRCVDRKLSLSTKNFRSFDIMNFKALLKEMQGVDAVIHLAINSSVDQPWRDTYTTGIGGTYNVFEAARQAGVKKIIYASTNHVSGWRDVLKESNIIGQPHTFPNNLRISRKRLLDNGFNQNKYKIRSSFKNRQLYIYCETCDLRILGSSNLDPKSELYQNIQKRVRLP